MMTLYKRLLLMGLSMSIAALAGLRDLLQSEIEKSLQKQASGSTPAGSPALRNLAESAPTAAPATTVSLSGTVIRSGSRFALLESAGALYTLSSTGRVWPFEGEVVRVSGKLDSATRFLHVDAIQRSEQIA